MNKKGYLQHPVVAIIVGFIVGMIVMFLIAKGIIPIGIGIC